MIHALERLSWAGSAAAAVVATAVEVGTSAPPTTQSVREWMLVSFVLFVLGGFGFMIRKGNALFDSALSANKAHADAVAKLADVVRDLKEEIREGFRARS